MYLPRLVHVFHLYISVIIVMDIIISASFVCTYNIHVYLAGYDETDLLPEIGDRLSVKKYGSSHSIDSGFGSTGSMFSSSTHLSRVRSKSCNAV